MNHNFYLTVGNYTSQSCRKNTSSVIHDVLLLQTFFTRSNKSPYHLYFMTNSTKKCQKVMRVFPLDLNVSCLITGQRLQDKTHRLRHCGTLTPSCFTVQTLQLYHGLSNKSRTMLNNQMNHFFNGKLIVSCVWIISVVKNKGVTLDIALV